MKKSNIYCIESLNCFFLLFFIVPRRIWHCLRDKPGTDELWFIKATPAGLIILHFIASFLRLKYLPWVFQILEVTDEQGNSMRLRVMCDDSNALHEYILQEEGIKEAFSQAQFPFTRLGVFLDKQTFSVDILEDHAHWKKLILIQTFLWDISRRKLGDVNKYVFLSSGLWAKAMACYAKQAGVHLCSLPGWDISFRKIITRLLGEHRPVYMYHFYKKFGFGGAAKAWLKTLWKRKNVDGLAAVHKQNPTKVLLEYFGQMNLDQPQLYSDLFFFPYSNIPPEDFVLTFSSPRNVLDKDTYVLLHKHGISELVTHPKASTVKEAQSFFFWPAGFKIKSPLFKVAAPVKQWIKYQQDNYAQQFEYWHHLFLQHKIGLYVSWFKHGGRHCVIADAMHSVGGIMVMYQRSLESLPSVGTMTSVDVFFGFSAQCAAMEKAQGSRIPYYVITGYGGDYRFDMLRPYAQELRVQVMSKGAKKVMAFFDENSHQDLWNAGHTFIQENYIFLLEKVLKEPWFGLILKPKTSSSLRYRLGNVAKLLAKAEATGRCIICGEGKKGNSYPPALAALASDVAVHGHLFAATAGLEAALAGVPTLLLDREGWRKSSLYNLGEGKVVFNNWQQLWKHCLSAWDNPKVKLGDWSGMIEDLDPFRDGKAVNRIGEYLTWLSQGLKSGHSREKILADTAWQYISKWGKDKIIQVGPDNA